jgi:hypothetical protein
LAISLSGYVIRVWTMTGGSMLQSLPIAALRRDGQTQSRCCLDQDVVKEYGDLLLEGIELPPVRAWFDGCNYWLTDGFHRVAATIYARKPSILVEVFEGNLQDARWDSFSANSTHGLRRTKADLTFVVRQALKHDRATRLSNRALARHINVSEKTIRRLRTQTSAAPAADVCVAIRNGRQYVMDTGKIGKRARSTAVTSTNQLETPKDLDRRLATELLIMQRDASPSVRRILVVIKHWIEGAGKHLSVVQALEDIVAELNDSRSLTYSIPAGLRVGSKQIGRPARGASEQKL